MASCNQRMAILTTGRSYITKIGEQSKVCLVYQDYVGYLLSDKVFGSFGPSSAFCQGPYQGGLYELSGC